MGYHMTLLLRIAGEAAQAVVIRVPQGDMRVVGEICRDGKVYSWKYWPYKRKPVKGRSADMKTAIAVVLDSNTIYTYRAVVGSAAGPQVSARSEEEARQLLAGKLKHTRHIFSKQWVMNGKDVQIWHKSTSNWQ